jgi:hypothetical protein
MAEPVGLEHMACFVAAIGHEPVPGPDADASGRRLTFDGFGRLVERFLDPGATIRIDLPIPLYAERMERSGRCE